MRRSVKFIASLVLALTMVVSTMEMVSAATYSWSATKSPGSQVGVTIKEIPVYKGALTFKITSLHGNCSYLLGKCVGNNDGLYYINNSSKSVMITKVNGEQSFRMKFVNDGDKQEYMTFRCTVEHNAGIGETVSAAGKIYY